MPRSSLLAMLPGVLEQSVETLSTVFTRQRWVRLK